MRNVYTLLIGFCLCGLMFTANTATANNTTSDYQISAQELLGGQLTENELLQVMELAAPQYSVSTQTLINAYRAGGVLITVIKDTTTGKVVSLDWNGHVVQVTLSYR